MLEECRSSFYFCNTFSNDIVLDRFRASEGLKVCSDRCNCLSDLRNCRYLLLMVSPGDVTLSTSAIARSRKLNSTSCISAIVEFSFQTEMFFGNQARSQNSNEENFLYCI